MWSIFYADTLNIWVYFILNASNLEQQGEMLNKAQTEQQNLFIEMEEMKTSLQKAEVLSCSMFEQ